MLDFFVIIRFFIVSYYKKRVFLVMEKILAPGKKLNKHSIKYMGIRIFTDSYSPV